MLPSGSCGGLVTHSEHFPFHKRSVLQNVHFRKCPFHKMSISEIVLFTKCPFRKLSFSQNVHFGNCPCTCAVMCWVENWWYWMDACISNGIPLVAEIVESTRLGSSSKACCLKGSYSASKGCTRLGLPPMVWPNWCNVFRAEAVVRKELFGLGIFLRLVFVDSSR